MSLSGEGGFNRKGNGNMNINYQNKNGTNLGGNYAHQAGWGHDVGLHAKGPVFATRDQRTTIQAGAGINQHFGGPLGTVTTGTSAQLGVSHKEGPTQVYANGAVSQFGGGKLGPRGTTKGLDVGVCHEMGKNTTVQATAGINHTTGGPRNKNVGVEVKHTF